MKNIQLDKLCVKKMASGHLCLLLTEQVSWKMFPKYAKRVIDDCDGVVGEKVESVDMRMWNITIDSEPMRIVFDDYPQLVTMESSSDRADLLIESLYERYSMS